ncbi:MAG TPA: sigma factor, partial [Kofleriaceae bacterium]
MIDRGALDRMMAAAADGDRAAIAPLFHALWPVVVRYATRLVGDASLAEDCAQDALVQLFGQLDRYDRGRDALTWALTLATWQAR